MRQSLLKNLHFNLSITYHNCIPFISQLDSVCFTAVICKGNAMVRETIHRVNDNLSLVTGSTPRVTETIKHYNGKAIHQTDS